MEDAQIKNKKNNMKIFRDAKFLIDQNIYKFLLALMKVIFIKTIKTIKTNKAKKILNEFIQKINKEIIEKSKELKPLSLEYSPENFKNIINFVKSQNSIFYSEILENILIIVFGMAFNTKKENIFGKYIYNNLDILKKNGNYILDDWFNPQKFNSQILEGTKDSRESYIKILLENDALDNLEENHFSEKQRNVVLFSFLKHILDGKLSVSKIRDKSNGSAIFSTSRTMSKYTSIMSNMYYNKEIGKMNMVPIRMSRSLLISVYIYCQIKNSPLMEYIKESDDNNELEVLPFAYDLSESAIEGEYSNIIFAPLRIEPRIEELKMSKLYMRGKSCLEFSKSLLFNQNIKTIDLHRTVMKSEYFNLITECAEIYKNNSVEELNISYNYLKEDSGFTLEYIISHFKKLKTLNLSSNDLKLGISPLLIALKNLYRKGKTNLENLYLNKCKLDDIAFYELGELLESKYCNLKKLYLIENSIPSNSKFLKKLKKNRALTQIYFNKGNIGNNNTDDIMRVISNCHLDYLYLNNNKISNFDQCLRILYRTKRTKIIKSDEKEGDSYHVPYLYNLDLSNNNCYNKNVTKLKLFENGIKEAQLYCLGFSQILFGLYPEKFKNNREYKIEVDNLTKELEKKEEEYKDTCSKINVNEVDKKRMSNIEYEEHFKRIDKQINNIINSKESQFPLFIRKQAANLIKEHIEIFNDVNQDIKNVHSNLVKYINLKKSELNLKKLEKEKNMKKMILI